MTLAISVFGVGAPSGTAAFVYAQLRTLRTVGRYASPSLPKSASARSVDRIHPEPGGFELQVWDTLLPDGSEDQVLDDLRSGRLTLPADSPIEPGRVLEGTPFSEIPLLECCGRMPVDGGGALRARGFVVPGESTRVIRALQLAVRREEVGLELVALLDVMDRESGLHVVSNALQPSGPMTRREGLFSRTRRFGLVEHLRRAQPDAIGFALSAGVTKPLRGSSDPCREVVITRYAGVEAVELLIRLEVRAWESVVVDRLITMPANVNRLKVDVAAHITSLAFQLYEPETGALIDQQEVAFIQNIGIGLALRTGMDVLSKPFRGAPDSVDLQERARVSTSRHEVANTRGSADTFDELELGRRPVDLLAGRRGWKAETLFFPPGPQSQIEVIRWLKRKIESVNVVEAFLVDPYLGTNALRRVVVRQGNQSVKLTILVSPAEVDPDAETQDASAAPGKHVADLLAAACELSGQFCGDIQMLDIQRGAGTRQAFHDRYLGLVGSDGRPSVYLLSNSLSRAAGGWPFTIAELDTPQSWQVAAYIRDLLDGVEGGERRLDANPVWRSGEVQSVHGQADGSETAPSDRALQTAYFELAELDQQGMLDERPLTDSVVDRLVAVLPSAGPEETAAWLMAGMHGREHFAVPILHRLSGITNCQEAAEKLDELVLERLLDRLGTDPRRRWGLDESRVLLRHVGVALSRRARGTDLVRNRINPILDAYARDLELGRSGEGLPRLIRGVQLVLVGLYLVQAGTTIPERFRKGIAIDYVNLLGRLLCSVESRRYFMDADRELDRPGWLDARDAIGLVRSLSFDPGLDLTSSAELVLTDPLIPGALLS